jgi:hypothetical protein
MEPRKAELVEVENRMMVIGGWRGCNGGNGSY